MERAILFFDIDGTVLSEVTKEVPQSAIEAMEKARAEGHLLFINTGRTICSIPTEVSICVAVGHILQNMMKFC